MQANVIINELEGPYIRRARSNAFHIQEEVNEQLLDVRRLFFDLTKNRKQYGLVKKTSNRINLR